MGGTAAEGMKKRSSSPRRPKRSRYCPSLALQLDPHFRKIVVLPLADGTVEHVVWLSTVCDLVGASPATLYRWMLRGTKKNPTLFPRPVRLGGRDKGKVAWAWRDILAWNDRCASISVATVPHGSATCIGLRSASAMTVSQLEWVRQPEPRFRRMKARPSGVTPENAPARRAERDFESTVARNETCHRMFAAGVLPERGGWAAITRDLDDHAYIAELDALVDEIAQTDKAPIGWEERNDGSRRYFLADLGGKLQHLSSGFSHHFLLQHTRHQFQPRVALLVQAFERWADVMNDCKYPYAVGVPVAARLAFNSTVRLIRYACRSKRFRGATDNDRRREIKEYQSACAYVASLFQVHPMLRVVRVHLYFPHPDPYARSIATSDWSHLTLANTAFAKFGRTLRRNRAFADVCGWLAVRSESFVQGVRFDLLAFLDGRSPINAAGYAAQLGQYWADRCTGPDKVGGALVPHLSSIDGGEQVNGTGLVVCTDAHGLLAIRAAIRAMCSQDYQLRVSKLGEHNFRRGSIRVPLTSRQGWVRQSYDLSAVMRILGGV